MSAEGRAKLYEELLPLLDSPLNVRGRVWSYCPVHGDGKSRGKTKKLYDGRSLSLTREYGLDCMAQKCSFEAIVKALRARAPQQQQGLRQQAQRNVDERQRYADKPTVAYEYRDSSGALIGVKGRFETPDPEAEKGYTKTFRWRLPEGDYRSGLKGLTMADLPLWGADQIAASKGRVWIAEGEKAAEAIRARQEIATCVPGSASQRDFGQSLEVLRGRDVILWPDNDEAGRVFMAELRKALRGIAKSVTTVSAPVPPKGDAVEFFQARGTIGALLEGTLIEPAVDVMAADHFVVRVPTERGPVAFDFAEMMKTSGALDCELTVSMLAPGTETEPYWQRINILSQSARSQLRLALNEQFGKEVNWTTEISRAYSRVRSAFFEFDRGAFVGDLPDVPDLGFMVDKILPLSQPTVLFGDGSAGKSYIALSLALAVVLGCDWLGLPVKQGAVLYVDFETSADQGAGYRRRMGRLLRGMGLHPSDVPAWGAESFPMFYWNGTAGGSLADQIAAIRRYVEKRDVSLVIVDSAVQACGGEPEKSVVAGAYFNALNSLPVTSITIAHQTKSDSASGSSYKPLGSGMWHNLARRTWWVTSEDGEEGADRRQIGMFNRKVNDGRFEKPIYLDLDFGGERTSPVTLLPSSAGKSAVALSQEDPLNQIRQYLLGEGSATPEEIEAATGLDAAVVKNRLAVGQKKGLLVITGRPRKRGESFTWGVAAQ